MQNLNLFRVEGSNFFHLRPPKASRDKNRLGWRFCRRVKFRENNSYTVNLTRLQNLKPSLFLSLQALGGLK